MSSKIRFIHGFTYAVSWKIHILMHCIMYMCFVQKKYIYMCCVQEKYLYSCIHVSCINEKYIYSCIRMHYVQEKLILLMHSHVLCPGKIHFTGTHAFTVGVSVILYLILTWLCTVHCTVYKCALYTVQNIL